MQKILTHTFDGQTLEPVKFVNIPQIDSVSTNLKGILATPPKLRPPRNKALLQ